MWARLPVARGGFRDRETDRLPASGCSYRPAPGLTASDARLAGSTVQRSRPTFVVIGFRAQDRAPTPRRFERSIRNVAHTALGSRRADVRRRRRLGQLSTMSLDNQRKSGRCPFIAIPCLASGSGSGRRRDECLGGSRSSDVASLPTGANSSAPTVIFAPVACISTIATSSTVSASPPPSWMRAVPFRGATHARLRQ